MPHTDEKLGQRAANVAGPTADAGPASRCGAWAASSPQAAQAARRWRRSRPPRAHDEPRTVTVACHRTQSAFAKRGPLRILEL